MESFDAPIPKMSELLLFFADRAAHVEQFIKPMVNNGEWVICDRFTTSTYAYQGGGAGMSNKTISTVADLAQGGREPDLTIVLDVDVEGGLKRSAKSGVTNRFEDEALDFHKRARDVFRDFARTRGDHVLVDGSQPEADVTKAIIDVIESRFPEAK